MDSHYKQISYLQNNYSGQRRKVGKLENSINMGSYIKDIEIILFFDKDGNNDEIDK